MRPEFEAAAVRGEIKFLCEAVRKSIELALGGAAASQLEGAIDEAARRVVNELLVETVRRRSGDYVVVRYGDGDEGADAVKLPGGAPQELTGEDDEGLKAAQTLRRLLPPSGE